MKTENTYLELIESKLKTLKVEHFDLGVKRDFRLNFYHRFSSIPEMRKRPIMVVNFYYKNPSPSNFSSFGNSGFSRSERTIEIIWGRYFCCSNIDKCFRDDLYTTQISNLYDLNSVFIKDYCKHNYNLTEEENMITENELNAIVVDIKNLFEVLTIRNFEKFFFNDKLL